MSSRLRPGIKQATKATIRVVLETGDLDATCIHTGAPAKCRAYFARSY